MKFLFLAAVCLFASACSSGSGSVVGNGLTNSPSRTQIMDNNGDMMPAGNKGCGCSQEHSCTTESMSCVEHKADSPKGEEACGCGAHHEHKAKAKKAK